MDRHRVARRRDRRLATLASLAATIGLVAGACSDDGPFEFTGTSSPEITNPDASTTTTPGATIPGSVIPGAVIPGATTLDWSGCDSIDVYQCATLAVPLDHDDPGGETIDLALIRRPASSGSSIAPIVVNFGGPGASGVDQMPGFVESLPEALTDRFDWVSWDPRGVGSSTALHCISDERKDEIIALDADPDTNTEAAQLDRLARQVGTDCGARGGELVEHMGTNDVAADLDLIRAALGEEQLTYLGISYGTRIGSVYADTFPTRVRAFVLDGAVEPDNLAADFDAIQAAGFERAFANFAAWCERSADCPAAPDPAGLYLALLDRAAIDPLDGDDGRQLTEGWIQQALINSMYAEELWEPLAIGLVDAARGNPEILFIIADLIIGRDDDGDYDNLIDVNLAVNCVDTPLRPTLDEVRALADELDDEYPLFGAGQAWSGLGCIYWPVAPDPIPLVRADGAAPIVVVGTTGDPATPVEWAERMAAALSSGVLVVYEGEGHAAFGTSDCVMDLALAYFGELTVPEDGTRCSN